VVTAQTGVSLAANLSLNLVLIPVLGGTGAALSIAASEAIGLVYLAASLSRVPQHAQARSVLGGILRVLVALVAALPVAVGVARWNWVAGLAAGLATYVVLLVATGALGRQDMKMLHPLLGGST
jgi:O-antigen/teichoic acid export membrane protein